MDLHESLTAQIDLVSLARAVGQSEGQKVCDEGTVEQLTALATVTTH